MDLQQKISILEQQLAAKEQLIQRNSERLQISENILEILLDSTKSINSEIELEKLVQRITDIGTEITGAQFGAFFYNVEDDNGESYFLYTISGVPKEAFSKFPMPRNTNVFDPTFSGKGTVRYDDVTQSAEYGHNAPYHGMPKGHLPVRSYLAVPVISSASKEVIGGLFFGHSTPGVFTENSEKLIEAVAAQAAVAMANARLFEDKGKVEAKLVEQREKYKSIFNATSDAMLIFDESGVITEANPAASRLHGYTAGEMIGMYGTTLMNQDPDKFAGIMEIALSGRKYIGQSSLQRKDGSPLQTEVSCSAFLHNGERKLLFVIRDVTAEQRTEKALENSEALANVMTNASPVALWMTDEHGGMVYVNKTWTDWTGNPLEMQLGNGWFAAILAEDRQQFQGNFMSALKAQKVYTHDFRIQRATGEVRWCAVSLSPYYGSDGLFKGYAGSCIDITDRKKAEGRLAQQNILINTITNNTFQSLYMLDEQGHCSYLNPAAEELIGYKLKELTAKPFHYYIHHTHPDGRHYPIEDCPISNVLKTGQQTHGEETFIDKNNRFFPVAYTASPIMGNGVPKGVVVEMRDISEERKLKEELLRQETEAKEILEKKVKERTEELEKSNYELLQFASVASHDLKEPLRKIMVYGNRLKIESDELLNEKDQKHLDNILASATRMSRLIDDLLLYSRVSQNNFEPQVTDLNKIVGQIISDLELAISEKKATIICGMLPTVKGIPSQLGQVFQNLISNSLKFSDPSRAPEISIRSENEGNCHKITYTDNGIGFNNQYAEKIFEVFQRLHTREQYEGTGIGLAIVNKIISQSGGRIKASGEEHIGSVFEIYLPIIKTF